MSTPSISNDPYRLDPIQKLTKDLRAAAALLSAAEVRYLVDAYYQLQEDRIRADAQTRSLMDKGEPSEVFRWLSGNTSILERNIKSALAAYSASNPIGQWAESITGIGPILSSGLLAHIDIRRCPTAGHIWRFSGLDSTVEWLGKEKAKLLVDEGIGSVDAEDGIEGLLAWCAVKTNRKPELIRNLATKKFDGSSQSLTRSSLTDALARRPWNAKLEVLCWKIGESFVKVSGNPNDVYGKLYLFRKMQEADRNSRGEYAEQAAQKLRTVRIGKDTDAYKFYSKGQLPPGHIHARAKRYAVKIFLSHWHQVAYKLTMKQDAPKPFPIAILGHKDEIKVPNWEMVIR